MARLLESGGVEFGTPGTPLVGPPLWRCDGKRCGKERVNPMCYFTCDEGHAVAGTGSVTIHEDGVEEAGPFLDHCIEKFVAEELGKPEDGRIPCKRGFGNDELELWWVSSIVDSIADAEGGKDGG